MRHLFHDHKISNAELSVRFGYERDVIHDVTRYVPIEHKPLVEKTVAMNVTTDYSTADVMEMLSKYPINYVATRTRLPYKVLEAMAKGTAATIDAAVKDLSKPKALTMETASKRGRLDWMMICKQLHRGETTIPEVAKTFRRQDWEVTKSYRNFLERRKEFETLYDGTAEADRNRVVSLYKNGSSYNQIRLDTGLSENRVKAIILHSA